ncbi:MAG: hypothetical protein U5J83_05365, partial [Bryobacterales bacterium]|nr:hypothetical protein [Bryobacterales bacterium]
MQRVPYTEIKSIAFVKDFDPPRGQTEQKAFQSRPKIEGLWRPTVRFRDGESAEGLLPNNLAQVEVAGFYIMRISGKRASVAIRKFNEGTSKN